MTKDRLTDEELLSVPVSDRASGLLNELLEAADEYAFLGAAHPGDQDAIQLRYDRAEHALRKYIGSLETRK